MKRLLAAAGAGFLFLIHANAMSVSAEDRPFSNGLNDGGVAVGQILSPAFAESMGLGRAVNEEKVYVLNRDKTEVAVLDFCCGGAGEVQRVEIFQAREIGKSNRHKLRDSMVTSFVTNAGVHLGMGVTEFLKSFGSPDEEVRHAGGKKLVYRLVEGKSQFLARHNMPLYQEEYIFRKGRLTGIRFGFEYP